MTNQDLTLVVDARTDGARRELAALRGDVSKLETGVSRLANIGSRIFTGAVILTGIRALRSGLGDTLTAFAEQERAGKQLEAVLRSTGGAAGVTAERAQELASEFQKTTRFMDEQVLSAENLLLTFINIKDDIFPGATAATLDIATALGQDLSSSAIQVGKALNDPIRGVTALRRVGVSFTEQQQEQIKVLVESGRTLEAQQLILAELNKEFGGSAANMTEFERNMDSVKDTVADTQEEIGKLATGGINLLFREIAAHKDDFRNIFEAARPAIAFLGDFMATRIGGIIGVIKNLIRAGENLGRVFSSLAHGKWAQAWESLKDVAVNLMKVMVNQIAALFGTIPNIAIDAINAAIREINKLQVPEITAFGKNLNPISGGFNIPEIPNIKTEIFDLGKVIDTLGNAATDASPPLQGARTDMDDLGSAAKSLSDRLKDFMSELTGAASDLFSRPSRELADLELRLAQLNLEQFRNPQFKPPELQDPTLTRRGLTQSEEERLRKQFEAAQALQRKQEDAAEKQRQAIETQIKDLQLQHEVWQKQLVAADKTLSTEAELRRRFEVLRDITGTLTGKIAETAGLLDKQFRDSINNVIKKFEELTTRPAPSSPPAAGPESHAHGLSYVPYDNYNALLHRGEGVLTAEENRAYQTYNNQRTVNVHVSRMTINGRGSRNDLDRFVGGLR